MAKFTSRKKINYGDMADEAITTDTPTVKREPTPTVTPTPTYTPAHAPNRKAKERKTERLQLVVRPSTKSRLARYADDHNTSSNEVVQQLLDKLLEDAGY